jgi:hypothetical protein
MEMGHSGSGLQYLSSLFCTTLLSLLQLCCNTNSPGYHSTKWGERCVHTAFQTLTPNPGATKRQMLVPYEVCSSSYLIGFPCINLQQAGLQMTYPRLLFIPVFFIYIIWFDIAWYSVWCIAPMKQGRGAAHMAKHGQTVGFLTYSVLELLLVSAITNINNRYQQLPSTSNHHNNCINQEPKKIPITCGVS